MTNDDHNPSGDARSDAGLPPDAGVSEDRNVYANAVASVGKPSCSADSPIRVICADLLMVLFSATICCH